MAVRKYNGPVSYHFRKLSPARLAGWKNWQPESWRKRLSQKSALQTSGKRKQAPCGFDEGPHDPPESPVWQATGPICKNLRAPDPWDITGAAKHSNSFGETQLNRKPSKNLQGINPEHLSQLDVKATFDAYTKVTSMS